MVVDTVDFESSDSSSAFSCSSSSGERDEIDEILKLAYKDTRLIRAWRFLLMGLLVSAGLGVTYAAYKFLRAEEFNNFETAFHQFSRTISNAALDQQRKVRSAMKGLAAAISASATVAGAKWPYYTMPYFEIHAANYRTQQAGIEFFSICPLVKLSERETYEAWAAENHEAMVQDSYTSTGVQSEEKDPSRFSPYIFGVGPQGPFREVQKESYFPVWQWSPPPYTYGQINWNVASVPDYDRSTAAAFALGNESVVSKVRPYTIAIGNSISAEEHTAMHSKLGNSKAEHPHSVFIHPIPKNVTDSKSDVVAILGTGVAWDAALQDLLPEGVWGVYAIIQNNCNQTFSYVIQGAEAFFIGDGDAHEAEYDDYEVVVDLALHSHPAFKATYGHCQFTMHVYPSRQFYESYQSNTPELFAVVVSVSFVVVVAIVFFVYDVLVQRRNFKLIVNAAKTNAIVASMFPAAVRDKVLNQKESNSSSILANLYPETTVLFADIGDIIPTAGFTTWCSIREPKQVFHLLETLYEAFDNAADRHRVFKVETVGDCYVAVTGLPDPSKKHAITMARFADDCIQDFDRITMNLAITLGSDTAELGLRVGLNSGPVTAGVLRGSKGRFQLFGDAMNTAARMESTGEANRIHASQATADELIRHGRKSWVSARTGKIQAKGKGEMQTYWIEVPSRKSKSVASVDSEEMF